MLSPASSASLFGRRATLGVVLAGPTSSLAVGHVLRIDTRVEGNIPAGPYLIAVKHQSMFETIEMVRIGDLPVIVIKRELADMPLFGLMTRRYGVIAVERRPGRRRCARWSKRASRRSPAGRSVIIYPEGTRVRVGETPQLKSGFAGALSRARPAGRAGGGGQRPVVGARLHSPQRHYHVQDRRRLFRPG